MSVLRRALIAASESDALERQVTSRTLTRRIAMKFIAGETLDDGIAAVREVAARGCTATLDFLGEAVTGPDDARSAQKAILTACQRINDESLPSGLSVKPTQMGLSFDPDLAFELIGEIATEAQRFDGHVNLDMEGTDVTEATVALCERLREAGHDNVGCALQSYLHRTHADVERLTATGASLRLIKGAYDVPPSIAYQDASDVDASFERSMDWLLAHGHYPRIATHDDKLIDRAKRTAIRLGRSLDDFEFQMLYGVRTTLQDKLVAGGWRMRIYIPFGDEWYPYFMRRIAERPANMVFFLRALAGS
ncbi:MAG: proline dehydrogenase family protein [Actinobacteria bacterium]|nr:proline dehydrogenase family protein [Actinomycetota bacterium]